MDKPKPNKPRKASAAEVDRLYYKILRQVEANRRRAQFRIVPRK